ncbi:MAG: hypothetical protein AAF938_00260 [Myxococcota bacterium]
MLIHQKSNAWRQSLVERRLKKPVQRRATARSLELTHRGEIAAAPGLFKCERVECPLEGQDAFDLIRQGRRTRAAHQTDEQAQRQHDKTMKMHRLPRSNYRAYESLSKRRDGARQRYFCNRCVVTAITHDSGETERGDELLLL